MTVRITNVMIASLLDLLVSRKKSIGLTVPISNSMCTNKRE